MTSRTTRAVILAAGLLTATAARADDDPPPLPECLELVPADTPPCRAPEGPWQTCPLAILEAQRCEVRILGRQVREVRADLAKALEQAAGRDGRWVKGTDALRAQRDEARALAAGARSRATWAWGLGVTGTALQAGAVAVLLAGGSKTIAAALAGVGAAGAASGVIVATW